MHAGKTRGAGTDLERQLDNRWTKTQPGAKKFKDGVWRMPAAHMTRRLQSLGLITRFGKPLCAICGEIVATDGNGHHILRCNGDKHEAYYDYLEEECPPLVVEEKKGTPWPWDKRLD